MTTILCAYSGIEYTVPHFSRLYLTEREDAHPIFSIPATRLLGMAESYMDNKMSDTESYLYYLALFNSTGLIQFRVPAIQTSLTQSIVATNMNKLLVMVERIAYIGTEQARVTLDLPQFSINPDTKDLSNTHHWVGVWHANYMDYQSGYKSSTEIERLSRMEGSLERLIKDKTKSVSDYATQLAEWAARAGKFHDDNTIVADGTAGDKPITLAEYWKKLIRMCAKEETIYAIHDGDLSELTDHCEEEIAVEYAGIQAHMLMTVLRNVQRKKKSYLDLGDIDIGTHGTTFRILDADTSIEDANKLALIDSAPLTEPTLMQYPNRLAYLKARMKWDMAVEYRKSAQIRESISAVDDRSGVDRRIVS